LVILGFNIRSENYNKKMTTPKLNFHLLKALTLLVTGLIFIVNHYRYTIAHTILSIFSIIYCFWKNLFIDWASLNTA